jgi:hypothetical protein
MHGNQNVIYTYHEHNEFQSILSRFFYNNCIAFGFFDKYAQLSLSSGIQS